MTPILTACCERPKERKNLIDDLPPVDSAAVSTFYLWCTLLFMFILTVIVEDASSYNNFHRMFEAKLKGDFYIQVWPIKTNFNRRIASNLFLINFTVSRDVRFSAENLKFQIKHTTDNAPTANHQ